ncbi:uncharacterized protein C20orf96 homolog [Dendropsophus ebraccatus]|uniref:uncharacterized protein C20orf96 homolog n=1 Tax=Dendropsophus ebraccatus TaxID=150705 RepID=UPI0038314C5A
MTSACCRGNRLTLDLSMSQRLAARGHHGTACTKTPDSHHVTPQTSTEGRTPVHAAGGKNPTNRKGRQKTSHCQLSKKCGTETEKLRKSAHVFMTYARQPVSSLLSQCTRLEEENASLLRQITKMEDEAMKSATQQLQQYDRAGSNVRAVQNWTEHQIHDAEQDLELIKEQREEHINGLRLQLQNCEEKIQKTQKELQQLREYRDRGHSTRTLQAAELERQLRVLRELHEDQAADVEALARAEINKLLESHQKLQDSVLQGVVEEHVESLPLPLKRMCLQNQEMRSEIRAYQQMITGLQDDIKMLLETGNSLRKSWNEKTDRLRRDLLLHEPRCAADEDVILDIPLNRPMYI